MLLTDSLGELLTLLLAMPVAALAVWEMIEIYHHSVLFAGVRARVELLEGKVHTLLSCPFCMSPWVAWALALTPFAVWPARSEDWGGWLLWLAFAVWRYAMTGFAVARLANLGNDLTRGFCRTPKMNREIPEQPSPGPGD